VWGHLVESEINSRVTRDMAPLPQHVSNWCYRTPRVLHCNDIEYAIGLAEEVMGEEAGLKMIHWDHKGGTGVGEQGKLG
jgi:hypothetical protein